MNRFRIYLLIALIAAIVGAAVERLRQRRAGRTAADPSRPTAAQPAAAGEPFAEPADAAPADTSDDAEDPAATAESVPASADDRFTPTSRHQGVDWADLGFGPNRAVTGREALPDTGAAMATQFVLDAEVAQRFNAYACAAWPREIGGLLKLDESEPGVVRAVDVKIFAHKAASGAYFELDEMDVMRFVMGLDAEGRGDEIVQWRSLIHSHPNMRPFLSGTDHENIVRLAGQSNAWSVICAARTNPDDNYFAVHYAQAAPMRMVVRDLPVTAAGGPLSGVDLLSDDLLDAIDAEVAEALASVGSRRGVSRPDASDWLAPSLTWH